MYQALKFYIMANFNPLNYKRELKNAQHFAFIQAYITALQAAGFTAARIVAKLAELISGFAEEDRLYMIVRASEIIAQRAAADEKRDRFYSRLHRLVQAWAGSGMALLDAAATALEGPFDLYKLKINAQLDEETGVLENLITDLSTPEMQAHLATINGTYLFQQMVEGQNQVKALRLEQGVEESEKVNGALSAARKHCDALYDEMCDLIESFSKVADDPAPYETFIRQWNGTVKIYQDMLNRKSGTSTSGTANPDGQGTTSPDNGQGGASPDPSQGGGNGGGTGTGDNQGGGTGTIDVTGGGGSSPTPDNGGGTTPDPSQGGGNGGSDNPENDGGD